MLNQLAAEQPRAARKPSGPSGNLPAEDPLSWIARIANAFHRRWVLSTYPFAKVGKNLRIHHTCDLRRSMAPGIEIGNSVLLDRQVWINIPVVPNGHEAAVVFEDGCTIGRRCVISARNRIHFEKDVILAPSVLVMDHNHDFGDITVPIAEQGITDGGRIRIEEGCWIGFGVAIVCNRGELVIGRNSVIGANSVLTRSVPPHSVVSGNPARVVKQFDSAKGEWVLGSSVAGQRKEKEQTKEPDKKIEKSLGSNA